MQFREEYRAPQVIVIAVVGSACFTTSPTGETFNGPDDYDGF